MNPHERNGAIEKMIREHTVRRVVSDALFRGGASIEHDKIHMEQRPFLNKLIEHIAKTYPLDVKTETSPLTLADILPITKTDLNTLHQHTMKLIVRGFHEIGIDGFENDAQYQEFSTVILEIIKWEKSHRDAEARSRKTN